MISSFRFSSIDADGKSKEITGKAKKPVISLLFSPGFSRLAEEVKAANAVLESNPCGKVKSKMNWNEQKSNFGAKIVSRQKRKANDVVGALMVFLFLSNLKDSNFAKDSNLPKEFSQVCSVALNPI